MGPPDPLSICLSASRTTGQLIWACPRLESDLPGQSAAPRLGALPHNYGIMERRQISTSLWHIASEGEVLLAPGPAGEAHLGGGEGDQ